MIHSDYWKTLHVKAWAGDVVLITYGKNENNREIRGGFNLFNVIYLQQLLHKYRVVSDSNCIFLWHESEDIKKKKKKKKKGYFQQNLN